MTWAVLENCIFYISAMYEFLHSLGHKPAYLSPRRAGGMSAMPTIVSDFAALQRRKCSAKTVVIATQQFSRGRIEWAAGAEALQAIGQRSWAPESACFAV